MKKVDETLAVYRRQNGTRGIIEYEKFEKCDPLAFSNALRMFSTATEEQINTFMEGDISAIDFPFDAAIYQDYLDVMAKEELRVRTAGVTAEEKEDLGGIKDTYKDGKAELTKRVYPCSKCLANLAELFTRSLTVDDILDNSGVEVTCPKCNTKNIYRFYASDKKYFQI